MTKLEARTISSVAFACFLAACASTSDGDIAATFQTDIPADREIGSLSEEEAAEFCRDSSRFLMQSSYRADSCRLLGVVAAGLPVAFGAEASNAELREVCSEAYDACLGDDDDPSLECELTERSEIPNCEATISDAAACLAATITHLHELVEKLPDCDSITAASLEPVEDAEATALLDVPAACRTYDMKCPGISDDALAFRDEYCELISPCCNAARLGSDCRLNVQAAAREGEYDEAAGAACLAALRERQDGGDFCDGLGRPNGTWDVVPECSSVFGIASPNEDPTEPGESTWDLPVTSTVGDPCVGTLVVNYDAFGPSDWLFGNSGEMSGLVCNHAAGLFCDETTRVCTTGRALGEACQSPEECDAATGYCDFSACVPRLSAGSSCGGSRIHECEALTFCHDATHRCTFPGDAGDACSPDFDSDLPPCRSGICNDGTCSSPLANVCGR